MLIDRTSREKLNSLCMLKVLSKRTNSSPEQPRVTDCVHPHNQQGSYRPLDWGCDH